MAPGVGKTYRMLREGQAEVAAGSDVVIGYLEPHNRPETSAQAADLEMAPRIMIEHGSASLPEMDLDAVLVRAPEIVLVDELAHTNAAGSGHEKRYEDVEVLLAHGINVISTVNVQHLESLNDQVADLTGVRVRETLPDAVLKKADEVVLIDQTPEDLIESACAKARSTPSNASRQRSAPSSRSKTSPPCAKSPCGRWPKRSARSGC